MFFLYFRRVYEYFEQPFLEYPKICKLYLDGFFLIISEDIITGIGSSIFIAQLTSTVQCMDIWYTLRHHRS